MYHSLKKRLLRGLPLDTDSQHHYYSCVRYESGHNFEGIIMLDTIIVIAIVAMAALFVGAQALPAIPFDGNDLFLYRLRSIRIMFRYPKASRQQEKTAAQNNFFALSLILFIN